MLRSLVALASLLFITAPLALADEAVTLSHAIRSGMVEATITGRGYSTGDCIRMEIRRKVAAEVRIKIDAGIVLESQSGLAQTMLVHGVKFHWEGRVWHPCAEIILNDAARHYFILEAYCRDYDKRTPGARDGFNVRPIDPVALAILARGKAIRTGAKIIQAAIWVHRNRVPDASLRQYFHCTADEIRAARSLVEVALTPDAKIEVEGTLKEIVERLARQSQAAAEAGFALGSRVEVVEDGAEVASLLEGALLPRPNADGPPLFPGAPSILRERLGGLVRGAKLKAGDQLIVTGFDGDHLTVVGQADGKPVAGRIKASAVKSQSTSGARAQIADALLEVFNRVE
jgi:hypothetical protein